MSKKSRNKLFHTTKRKKQKLNMMQLVERERTYLDIKKVNQTIGLITRHIPDFKEVINELQDTKSHYQILNEFFEILGFTKEEIKYIFWKNNTPNEILDKVITATNEFMLMTNLEKANSLNMTEEEFLNVEVA